MNKSIIIAVSVLVLVIVGSVAYYFSKNRENQQVQSVATIEQNKDEKDNFVQ